MGTGIPRRNAGATNVAAALLLCAALGVADAQSLATREKVSFVADTSADPGATVRGELRIPSSPSGRLPAVLILHSSNGVDGTGSFYADALVQAGIATLELDMFPGGGRPRSTRFNMPHAYGALLFLSAHPRIDPARIGTMGFSWGGVMSLFAASEEITRQYAGGRARFAAHLGIYPVCWAHLATFSGKNPSYDPGTYRMLTGAPVHILAGDKDDYDDPDTCQKFVDALPDDARRAVRVTVYPGAYHSWDRPGASAWTVHDANAYKGRGGMVRSQADQEIASRSRQFAVEFFTTQLVQKQ